MGMTTSSTRSLSKHSPAAQGQEARVGEGLLVVVVVVAAAARLAVEHEKRKVPQPATVSNKATFLGYYSSSSQSSFLGN